MVPPNNKVVVVSTYIYHTTKWLSTIFLYFFSIYFQPKHYIQSSADISSLIAL
jgi:hypothetical protein